MHFRGLIRILPAALFGCVIVAIPLRAQSDADSVQVTFRAFYPSGSLVYVPGNFNNWGPNNSGSINPGAASMMAYSADDRGYIKSYTFKTHDPSRTVLGDSSLQYKFNLGGSSTGWNSDPYNTERNAADNNNSVLRLAKMFWFEVNVEQGSGSITRVLAGVPHRKSDTVTAIWVRYGSSESSMISEEATFWFDPSTNLLNYPFASPIAKSNAVVLVAYNNHGDSVVYRRNGYTITVAPIPSYVLQAVTLGSAASNDSVSFRIRVPSKDFVMLHVVPLGQRPDTSAGILMIKAPNPSDWWINLKLAPGTYEYVYEFPDGRKIYDPWGRQNGTYGSRFTVGAAGLTADDYVWHDQTYQRPPLNKIVIYEMSLAEVVGGYNNWDGNHAKNFKDLIPLLRYYDSLGINCIELMPINDYGAVGASGFSWGYDLNTAMALEPGLGTPRDFKALVDSAHAHGIAIIIDVVFNHLNDTGPLWSMQPDVATNPYFHNGGTNKNEDGIAFFKDLNHWSSETQEYCYAALKQWIDVYHVDGFRFDYTRGIGWDKDNPNVGVLGWANKIDADYHGSVYQIAEHLPDSPTLINLSGLTSGWHDPFHDIVYTEATSQNIALDNIEKYVLDTYTYPSVDVPNLYDHYLDRTGPVQIGVDHDEWSWVHGMINQAGLSNAEAVKRDKLYATFIFNSLGVPFLWEGMEHGEDRGWLNDNEKLSYRRVNWSLGTTPAGQGHFNWYRSLIFQRLHNPALYQGTLRKLFRYTSQRSIVWGFQDTSSPAKVMCVANLSNADQILRNVPWLASGTWFNALDQSELVAGGTTLDSIVVPAHTAVVYSNRSNDNLLDVGSAASGLPEEFALSQNYPNPFNPSTNIGFTMKVRADVHLAVYDVLGRLVRTLVDGELSAGEHQVAFNTGTLASGVYFYRLQTPGFSATRKMLITK